MPTGKRSNKRKIEAKSDEVNHEKIKSKCSKSGIWTEWQVPQKQNKQNIHHHFRQHQARLIKSQEIIANKMFS